MTLVVVIAFYSGGMDAIEADEPKATAEQVEFFEKQGAAPAGKTLLMRATATGRRSCRRDCSSIAVVD